MSTNGTPVIVLSPHPDDETLGAGGTLLRWRDRGSEIHWLNFTHPNESWGWDKARIARREEEMRRVAEALGCAGFYNLALEPAGLDKYPLMDIVLRVSKIFQEVQPHTVLLPWRGDAHSDHAVVYSAALSCTKSFRYPSIKRVLAMEILSETNFGECEDLMPNYFCDISDYLERKLEIMGIYGSEMGAHPFPRSEEALRSLAILRGSQAACRYAEAFRILRWIDRD